MIKFEPHRLVVARAARGLTQLQLADRLSLTGKQISKFETNILLPKIEVFCKICEVLEVSPNFLLGLSSFSELDEKT